MTNHQETMLTRASNRSYRFDVLDDGTWDNRKTFAFVDSGVPDGISAPTTYPLRGYRGVPGYYSQDDADMENNLQVSTPIRTETCTPAAAMASTSGIPPGRSSARSTWARRRRTSSLPATVAW